MNKPIGKTESGKEILNVDSLGRYGKLRELPDVLRAMHLFLSFPHYTGQDHLEAAELHAAHAAAILTPATPESRKARFLEAAKVHRECAHRLLHALDQIR